MVENEVSHSVKFHRLEIVTPLGYRLVILGRERVRLGRGDCREPFPFLNFRRQWASNAFLRRRRPGARG